MNHLIKLLLLLPLVPFAGCGQEVSSDLSDPQELLARYDHDRRRHDPRQFVEVELGEYFVTRRQPDNNIYTIRCKLFAVVPRDKQPELEEALTTRRTAMRDAILGTIRSTEFEHLTEPTLSWVKSEMIPIVNRSLKTRVLRDIVFADYSFERA